MNVKELNIDRYYLRKGKVFKINAHDLADILMNGGEYNFEPIPLTENVLLKCCFGKSDEHEMGHNANLVFGFYYDYHFKNFRLEIDDDKHGIDVKMDIKYLHELQNLFYTLTKNELEVNI